MINDESPATVVTPMDEETCVTADTPASRADLVLAFEEQRPRLRGIAYRILGSYGDAEDAVQESWLRLQRTAASAVSAVENLAGWLTTVVSRICLDMLRARGTRPEQPVEDIVAIGAVGVVDTAPTPPGPEDELLATDAVGAALLVVLDQLSPAERLAFVLHDLFGLPFEEIAPIVDRTPAATRQLASRARRRVRDADPVTEQHRQREAVAAFLAASREGDFGALLQLLDPEVELRADSRTVAYAQANADRGAPLLAEHVVGADAVARVFAGRAAEAQVGLVAGVPAAIWAPQDRPRGMFAVLIRGGRIVSIEVVTDAAQLADLPITLT